MAKELSVLEKSLLENINKKFGKDNPMVRLSESDYGEPRGWIDTGILALNWLISGKFNGGYPVGRITELDGDPGTGKSLLCQIAMADPTNDLIIYFDTEAALNKEFMAFLGVDSSKVLYEPIDTIEQIIAISQEVLDTIIMNKQTQKKVLMIIDSVALASTEKEMDPEKGSDMGYKARMLRKFFRVYARKIEKYNIALLVTNHYTQKIGIIFGNPKTTTGGTALPYAASVRIDLKIVETEIANKKLEALGASSVTLKAKTEKNRCFSPKRKITFVLDFEKGVHRFSGLFKILKEFNIAEKNGAWCRLSQWKPDEKFLEKSFPQIAEENNLLPLIEKLLNDKIKNIDIEVKAEIEAEAIDEAVEKDKEIGKKKKRIPEATPPKPKPSSPRILKENNDNPIEEDND